MLKIMGMEWSAVLTEEGRRSDNDKLLWRCQPDGDHVLLNDMAKANSCIESLLDDVDQAVLAYEFQLDVRIHIQEVRQQSIHEQGQTRPRDVDAQPATDFPSQTASRIQAGCQHFYGWARVRQEAFSRFRQADTPGCPGKKRRTDSIFKATYCLTYRRGRHAEAPCSSTKAPQLCDGQKHHQSVKMRPLHW